MYIYIVDITNAGAATLAGNYSSPIEFNDARIGTESRFGNLWNIALNYRGDFVVVIDSYKKEYPGLILLRILSLKNKFEK